MIAMRAAEVYLSSTLNGCYLGEAVKNMIMAHNIRTSRSRLRPNRSAPLSGTHHQHSQFGYAVSWVHPWIVAGIDDSVASSTGPGTDSIVIDMSDSGLAEVRIVGADRRHLLDCAETLRFWTSSGYLSQFMKPGTAVVLSDRSGASGAVVLVSPGGRSGKPVVTMKESYDAGQRDSIRVTFTAELTIFQEAYRSLQQNVLIDGRSPLRCFSADVLQAVLP